MKDKPVKIDGELKGRIEKFISKKLVVIDFWASWCMPCLIMSPIIEELAEKFKQVKFGKVNVDDNSNLANKFKIMSIPTLKIFKDGKDVETMIGLQSKAVLLEMINKHSS